MPPQSPTQNIRNLQLGAQDPGAWAWANQRLAGNVGQSVPETPYEKFNLALMEMLQRYQNLSRQQLTQATTNELDARQAQVQQGLAPLSPELTGAGLSPSQIMGVRQSGVQAMQPSVSGAQEQKVGLAQMLESFGTGLEQAGVIGKYMYDVEADKKKNLMDALWKNPQAFKSADEETQTGVEKTLGLPKGFIQDIPVEEKKKNTQVVQIGDRQKLIDLNTGVEIRDLGPVAVTTKSIEAQEAQVKAKSEALVNLNLTRELLVSPGLSSLSGGIQGFIPAITTKTRYAKKLYEQIKNTLTVANRQKMKGQGTVSDWEGKLLESASTALARPLSDEDFVKELKKVKAGFTAYAGLLVDVKIINQQTGEAHLTRLTPEDVEDAIRQGYLIEYQ